MSASFHSTPVEMFRGANVPMFHGHGRGGGKHPGVMPGEHLIPHLMVQDHVNHYKRLHNIPASHEHLPPRDILRIVGHTISARPGEHGGLFPLALGAMLPLITGAAKVLGPAMIGAVGSNVVDKIFGKGIPPFTHGNFLRPVHHGGALHWHVHGGAWWSFLTRFARKAGRIMGPRIKRLGHTAMASLMEAAIEALTKRREHHDERARAPTEEESRAPAAEIAADAAASEPTGPAQLATDTTVGAGYRRRKRQTRRKHPFY